MLKSERILRYEIRIFRISPRVQEASSVENNIKLEIIHKQNIKSYSFTSTNFTFYSKKLVIVSFMSPPSKNDHLFVSFL